MLPIHTSDCAERNEQVSETTILGITETICKDVKLPTSTSRSITSFIFEIIKSGKIVIRLQSLKKSWKIVNLCKLTIARKSIREQKTQNVYRWRASFYCCHFCSSIFIKGEPCGQMASGRKLFGTCIVKTENRQREEELRY